MTKKDQNTKKKNKQMKPNRQPGEKRKKKKEKNREKKENATLPVYNKNHNILKCLKIPTHSLIKRSILKRP